MTNPQQDWPYPGSRWWKFDFHTHTPASADTFWARSGTDLSPEAWLLRYMAAEIDCVAITDHNSGAWIDFLKAAYEEMKRQADGGSPPEGFREMMLFSGVEISVQGGFHLLAILAPNTTHRRHRHPARAGGLRWTQGRQHRGYAQGRSRCDL